MNANMRKGAIDLFNYLPNSVKTFMLDNDFEGFERLLKDCEAFEILREREREIEVESEREIEVESELKFFKKFAHLKITIEENQKLLDEKYTQEQINKIYDSIENYKKNTNYKSLYLTAKKWLEKEYPKNKIETIDNHLNESKFKEQYPNLKRY